MTIVCVVACLAAAFWVLPAGAITIQEEEDLSKEVMQAIVKTNELINDPMIVEYVNAIGQKIVSNLTDQPFNYRFYIVKADAPNAFATPAGHIFINSGLVGAMESEDELAGILSHEIAHIVCRHISSKIERSKTISMATLAGALAGAILRSGGSKDVGQAVSVTTMAAGQSAFLSYSREDERQADQLGLRYLQSAGYSAKGLITVLERIRSIQWYNSNQVPGYLLTHPGTKERMAYIDSWMEKNESNDSRRTVTPYAFQRTQARLVGVYGDENLALRKFEKAVNQNPEDPMAHYGFGLVLFRKGRLDESVGHFKKALEKRAFDPYLLNDLGRVYFQAGRYEASLASLNGTLSIKPDHSEALFLLGRIQLEQGDLTSAKNALEKVMAVNPNYPMAAYFLGEAYGKLRDLGPAHYFLGIHYKNENEPQNAVFHLKKAISLLPESKRRDKAQILLREIREKKGRGEDRS